MAWTAPATYTANTALTAATLNTHLRDNMNETEAAKATTEGAWIVSTGANALAERIPNSSSQTAIGTVTSTTYTDLTGGEVGPTVTVTTGTKALVILTAQMYNDTSSAFVGMSYAVSGASSISASDVWCVGLDKNTPSKTFLQISTPHLHTVTAGVNTFTAKYRVTSNKGYVQVRRMQVIPF